MSRHAYRQATISSGASLASGATHCTSRNWSTPSSSPGLHQALREVLRAGQDDQRGDDEQRRCRPAAGRRGSSPTQADVPMQVGLLGRRLRQPPRVRAEDRTRTAASTSVSVCAAAGQRVQRGDAEEDDLGGQRARHLHAARCGTRCRPPPLRRECQTANVATSTTSGHPMPTSTRFAPVMLASASVHGVSAALRAGTSPRPGVDLPGLPAEHEVDGVLGQHGQQREHRQRQPGADVDLGGLGRPRQHERRADDRDAVDERGQWRGELGVREAEVGGGAEVGARQGRQQRDRELRREAPRVAVCPCPSRLAPLRRGAGHASSPGRFPRPSPRKPIRRFGPVGPFRPATWSTSPYSRACSAVNQRSRSASAVTVSTVCPVCRAVSSAISRFISPSTPARIVTSDGRAAERRRRLVHEDPRVRQRVPLAGRARREQELPHRRRQPDGPGRDVRADELHGVVDRHARGDRAAGGVDVEA